MGQVICKTPVGSMRLAHSYLGREMIKPGRVVWGIWWRAEYGTVLRKGRVVASKPYDPDRTYGYDVRAIGAQVARAES